MSGHGLRDIAPEMTPGLREAERLSDVTIALDAEMRRSEAMAEVLCVIAEAFAQMMEPEDRERLASALSVLRAPTTEAEQRVSEHAARSRALGSDALDRFLEEREAKRRAEPWIAPRGMRRRPGDRRVPAGTSVIEVAKDTGRVWGQSPDRPPDPLDLI